MFKIKKVLAVDNNLSLEECEKILVSDEFCLGILDANREIESFVVHEDLVRVLKFDIKNYPINLIATLTNVIDVDINNINPLELEKYISQGLNKGIFVGKDRKSIDGLILTNTCLSCDEKFLLAEYEKNIPEYKKDS